MIILAASVEAQTLDFTRIIRMPDHTAFRIRAGKEYIGKGRLLSTSRSRIHIAFEIHSRGQAVQADVTLFYVRSTRHEHICELSYSGLVGSQTESAREQVAADKFLAENGVLTFSFMNGQRFLQLGTNERGERVVTTDWGAGVLVPDK